MESDGYCIAKAGCGPTSMAVVITSLTGKWVTPLGYSHLGIPAWDFIQEKALLTR